MKSLCFATNTLPTIVGIAGAGVGARAPIGAVSATIGRRLTIRACSCGIIDHHGISSAYPAAASSSIKACLS